jgi:DNA invertase Pin-like site-specific DNA recombinase
LDFRPLNELHALGIDLYLHQQALDTSTPSGRAMFNMCGVFAEFERAMIQERVKSGLSRARANGKRLGRKPHGQEIEAEIKRLHSGGMGKVKIGKNLGIGTSSVQRVLTES